MSRASRQDTVPAVVMIVAATLFTVGRSAVVARNGMRLAQPAAKSALAEHAPAAVVATGPDMKEIDHSLRGGNVMFAGLAAVPVEPPPPVVPRHRHAGADQASALDAAAKAAKANLHLVGVSSDFAILRDSAGDHSVRIGSWIDGYTVRQIVGSTVILQSDAGESVTLGLSRADQ